MKITLFVIKFAPLGIFGIVAKVIADQENLLDLFKSIGLFMAVVIAGLLFHALVTLPSILKFIGRTNPIKFFNSVLTPLLTAFSTQSSNATLPLTIEAIEDNAGVSNKISSFTLPLGATINMDGTALYELAVAGFIAQIYGIDLSISQQVIMVLTALLASIGTAAIPMASLVTMTIIFTAVGLPLEGIAIVMPVERILDMFRTTVNVWSDCCGAATIAVSEGEKLKV
jgi:proton glutamate symport protein